MRRLLVSFCVSLFAIGAYGLWQVFYAPLPFTEPARPRVEFTVRPGMNLRQAAEEIQRAGVALSPTVLAWLGRASGRDRQIQAGSYEIAAGLSLWELLAKLTRGDVTLALITIPEGKTFAEMRALIDAHPDLIHDSAGMSEAQLLTAIGAELPYAEGHFFPDTYLFAKRSSDLDL